MKPSSFLQRAAMSLLLLGGAAHAVVTGALDPSFGSGGVVRITGQSAFGPQGLLVQPGGKIVYVATRGNGDAIIGRLGPDGAVDTGFGVGGTFTYSVSGGISAPVIAEDAPHRAIVLAMTHLQSGIFHLVLCRILDNGTLDNSFTLSEYPGQQGCVQTNPPPGAPNGTSAVGVALDASGGIIVGGMAFAFSETPNIKAFVFAATPGGLTSSSVEAMPEGPISLSGMTMNPLSNAVFLTGSVTLAASADGDSAAIVIRGSTITVWAHTVLNANFSPHGFEEGRALTVRPDNAIVMTGVADSPPPTGHRCMIYAFNSSLTPIDFFGEGGGGTRYTPFSATTTDGASCNAIVSDSENRLLVGGTMTHNVAGGDDDMLGGRFTRMGALDVAFGASGAGYSALTLGGPPMIERAQAIGVQNGRAVLAGPSEPLSGANAANSDMLIVRLLEQDYLFASGVE